MSVEDMLDKAAADFSAGRLQRPISVDSMLDKAAANYRGKATVAANPTPQNHIELAAMEIDRIERLNGEKTTALAKQAIVDQYRQAAGMKPLLGRDFLQEGLNRRNERNALFAFSAGGMRSLAGAGTSAIGVVAPETASRLQRDVSITTGEDVGAAGMAGRIAGAGLVAVPAVATGSPLVAGGMFGAQGFGGIRRDVVDLRRQGKEISAAEEFGTALTTGILEGGSGFVTAGVANRIAPALMGLAPGVRTAAAEGGGAAVKQFLMQQLRPIMLAAGIEATEESLTQIATNTVRHIGIDPEQKILAGSFEAGLGGAVLSPFLSSVAGLRSTSNAGEQQQHVVEVRNREKQLPDSVLRVAADGEGTVEVEGQTVSPDRARRILRSRSGEETQHEQQGRLESELEERTRQLEATRAELEHERVEARTDPLTRIGNRKAEQEEIQRITQEADETGESIAWIETDLANFKVANDELGHDVGDQILVAEAEAIREAIREQTEERSGDFAGSVNRVGGDEFPVKLRNVNHENRDVVDLVMQRANEIFQRKLDEIIGDMLPTEARPFIAYGHAIRKAGDTRSSQELSKLADQRAREQKDAEKEARGVPKDREGLQRLVDARRAEIEQREIEGTARIEQAAERTQAELLSEQIPTADAPAAAAQTSIADRINERGRLSQDDVLGYIRDLEGGDTTRLAETLGKGPFVLVQVPVDLPQMGATDAGNVNPEKLEDARDFLDADSPPPPVVVDAFGTIVDGKARLLAAQEAELSTIGVVMPEATALSFGLEPINVKAEMRSARREMATEPAVEIAKRVLPPQGPPSGEAPSMESQPDYVQPRRLVRPQRPARGAEDVANSKPGVRPGRFSVPQGVEDLITPISTRIRNISMRLYGRLIRFEAEHRILRAEMQGEVAEFLRLKNRVLTRAQRRQFKKSVLNERFAEAEKLLSEAARTDAERKQLRDGLRQTRDVLDRIYSMASDAGIKVGFRENYWPRRVRNYDTLEEKLNGRVRGEIERAFAREVERKHRNLTAEERTDVANRVLQGFGPRKPGDNSGNFRKRTVEDISDDLLDDYADADDAVMSYINTAVERIARRRFFGRRAGADVESNLEESIGELTRQLLDTNEITPRQQRELIGLLRSRFGNGEVSPGAAIRVLRDAGYITVLGNPLSALTQLGDLFLSAARNGLLDTTLSLATRKRLTMREFGIERIAAEFSDPGKLSKALDWAMTVSGFKRIDQLGKETFLNAAMRRWSRVAGKPGSKVFHKFEQEYREVFGDEFDNLVADLQADRISDNVRLLLFMELSGVQPITLSEMPKKYLDSPNGRVFYMLKTFTIKQFDYIRRNAFAKMNRGDIAGGAGDLLRFAMIFGVGNALVDLLKRWLLGRPLDSPARIKVGDIDVAINAPFADVVLDNILRVFGGSKYLLEKSAREGVGYTFMSQILPPSNLVDDAGRDLFKLPSIIAGDEGVRSLRNVPVVGKLLYWRVGEGVERAVEERVRDVRLRATNALRKDDITSAKAILEEWNDRRPKGTPPIRLSSIKATITQERRERFRKKLEAER